MGKIFIFWRWISNVIKTTTQKRNKLHIPDGIRAACDHCTKDRGRYVKYIQNKLMQKIVPIYEDIGTVNVLFSLRTPITATPVSTV